MAVTAQAGVFSFGAQTGKGALSATFWKHRASDIDLATISDDRLGPPEVGGVPVPTIPYRAGVMAAGGAMVNPRLEDTIGWLLHGALGAMITTVDTDVFEVASTGVNHHQFKFATAQGFVPYMSFRKHVPGELTADDVGEEFQDCKIVNLTIAFPNDGLITSRVDVLGRAAGTNFVQDPSGWQAAYGNTQFEAYPSLPIGSVTGGYLKIPGFSGDALPVTAATVTLTNAPLDIRQEKNYGSPYLDEVTIVGRSMTVDLILKWKDPELYAKIITGATDGTNWTAAPFVEDFDIYALSPNNIPTMTSPYELRVTAPEVMYQVQGGIRLAGNEAVMLRVTGTAIAGTEDYCVFHLANEVSSTDYTWPT